MKPRELTDQIIKGLAAPAAGRIEVVDPRTPGLVLRITRANVRTWAVRGRRKDGGATRVTIGPLAAFTLAEARKRALQIIAALRRGEDPVGSKREAKVQRIAAERALTVSGALARWQEFRVAHPTRPWSARYAAEVARLVAREFAPAVGERALAGMGRSDWMAIISAKWKQSAAVGAMLYRTVSAFLRWAEGEGLIEAFPLPARGLARHAPGPPSRDRVLDDEELRAVWFAADREAAKPRALVRLLMLTAARLREVANMRFEELDLRAATWTIPPERTKNGRRLLLPLGNLALAELANLWPIEATLPGAYVLAQDPTAKGGFSGFAKLKARIDRASGVKAWVLHDLRRSARSTMSRLGIASSSAEAALGHVSHRSALERVYDRHDFAPEAAAASRAWQEYVAELVAPPFRPFEKEEKNAG